MCFFGGEAGTARAQGQRTKALFLKEYDTWRKKRGVFLERERVFFLRCWQGKPPFTPSLSKLQREATFHENYEDVFFFCFFDFCYKTVVRIKILWFFENVLGGVLGPPWTNRGRKEGPKSHQDPQMAPNQPPKWASSGLRGAPGPPPGQAFGRHEAIRAAPGHPNPPPGARFLPCSLLVALSARIQVGCICI